MEQETGVGRGMVPRRAAYVLNGVLQMGNNRTGGQMNRRGRWRRLPALASTVLLPVLAAVLVLACTPERTVVREVMMEGDRQREWALVYYHSWRSEHKEGYLRLARRYMRKAIGTYFTLQQRIKHSYPDFYIVDERRMMSCRFLDEMNRRASQHSMATEGEEEESVFAEGCFYRPPPVALF